jgi:hypothetical protein
MSDDATAYPTSHSTRPAQNHPPTRDVLSVDW